MPRAGSFLRSLRFATNGLLRTLCTQRNMKIHWVSGLAVMLVGMALNLDMASRASVIFCVFVVLCMEVLNTALEAFVDLHVKQYLRTAMIAKDAAAAAVLVLAFGSVIVLADVLLHSWQMVQNSGPAIVRTILVGLPLLFLVGTMLVAKRQIVALTALVAASLGSLAFLAYHSRDEVFSLCALGFVATAGYAKLKEPTLLDLPSEGTKTEAPR